MNALQTEIRDKFKSLFGGEPLLVQSPGRINLIGEHTDYNDGFVMPAAIDRQAVFAIGLSPDNQSTVHAAKFNESFSVDIRNPERVSQPLWANYLLGVLHQFVSKGYPVKPFNCVFGGDIPVGAGLSSSAAIECGFGAAVNELFRFGVPKDALITMAQWAEHHYAGVKCGIMDQFASVMGKQGHVLLLDCRNLEYRYVPVALQDEVLLLFDSRVKHSLVDSEYNRRRQECEQGIAVLRKIHPEITSLRDVREEVLREHAAAMPQKVFNRCLYVVQEIQRVQEAARDLAKGDLEAFGKKMYETHDGLSQLYEVSCPEMDFLVNEARKAGVVKGARMMGGGFGGCTINLVRNTEAERFTQSLSGAYRTKFGREMGVYHVQIEGGTGVVSDIAIVH